MLSEHVIDLNTYICDIPDDVTEVSVINASDDNIIKLNLPNTVTSLDIQGKLTNFVVPYHIEDLCCCSLGLKTIKLNDNLKFLACTNNDLETLDLPQNIISVWIARNKLTSLTCSQPLKCLQFLDIQDNKFKNFDIVLPNTMRDFFIEGNPEIRIRHIDFVFKCDENDDVYGLIDGDYMYILGNGRLLSEFVRNKVAQHSYTGQKYIDFSNW